MTNPYAPPNTAPSYVSSPPRFQLHSGVLALLALYGLSGLPFTLSRLWGSPLTEIAGTALGAASAVCFLYIAWQEWLGGATFVRRTSHASTVLFVFSLLSLVQFSMTVQSGALNPFSDYVLIYLLVIFGYLVVFGYIFRSWRRNSLLLPSAVR